MNDFYEITTVPHFLYLDREIDPWLSAQVVFDAPVSGSLLQDAVADMLRAMPFLGTVKGVSPEGDRYVLRMTSGPFPVRCGPAWDSPRDRVSGDYLLSVSYDGDTLYLDISHALTDGYGFGVVLRYLVSRYLEYRREEPAEPAESFNRQFPYDYENPFDYIRDPGSTFEFRYPQVQVFDQEELNPGRPRHYVLSCDESRVMKLAKNSEGSFSGVLCGVLGCALMDCKPAADTVVISCPMNMRGTLGCTQTLRCCSEGMIYVLTNTLRKYPFEQKLSVLKGQLYIQRSEEYCVHWFAKKRLTAETLRSIPSIEEKQAYLRSLISLSPYPVLTDFGVVDFGRENEHVKSLRTFYEVSGTAGILGVLQRFRGRCCLNISSAVRDEEWLDRFCRILNDVGADCQRIPLVGPDGGKQG